MGGWFATNEVLIQTVLVYSLLAFSVQVSLRAGVFSLAGVGCWALGAYTVAILTLRDVPVVVAVLAALALCAAVSWLLALLLVRLRGLYLGMATFAFVLLVGVVAINGGDLTGGANGLFGVPLAVSTWQIALVVAFAAAALAGLEWRALGRAFTVAREDEELAEALAVDTVRMRRFAFVLSGVLGALGGSLNVLMVGAVAPTEAGFELIVVGLTMVIIGGYHSWLGALIGAALVQWMPIALQSLASWWTVIYGVLVIVVAIYAPAGILGLLRRVWAAAARAAGGRRELALDQEAEVA